MAVKQWLKDFSLNGASYKAGDALPDHLTTAQVETLERRGVVGMPPVKKTTKPTPKTNTKDN